MSVGHYENFPVASRLVPAPLRPAVRAIYRFARTADDLADEGDAPSAVRLRALDDYDRALDAIERGETPERPPFPELAAAVRKHSLPIEPLRDLLSAFKQDVLVTRYASYADLLDYCRRSANPVGRLLLALYGAQSAANLTASDAICTGLQLTNFWQDVALDWQKNRVYLPQEDLERFGVSLPQIAQQRVDDHWRALVAFEVSRTRALFASGWPLTRELPWRLGLELSAVIAGGSRVLDRIDTARGDVFAHRPVLGTRDWFVIAYHALVPKRDSSA